MWKLSNQQHLSRLTLKIPGNIRKCDHAQMKLWEASICPLAMLLFLIFFIILSKFFPLYEIASTAISLCLPLVQHHHFKPRCCVNTQCTLLMFGGSPGTRASPTGRGTTLNTRKYVSSHPGIAPSCGAPWIFAGGLWRHLSAHPDYFWLSV